MDLWYKKNLYHNSQRCGQPDNATLSKAELVLNQWFVGDSYLVGKLLESQTTNNHHQPLPGTILPNICFFQSILDDYSEQPVGLR